uniref:NADH-ubiquinone oxidoreductase chain 3 n=1 Tax=Gastrocopta cristata TaxID=1128339 RepID=A0A0A6ZAD3_9EUPU|nr:NADH dehydrogenase subunit 3 [Gastrocopta cristata]AGC52859.1 NADH dehydrogenase subunit 3 [Gastrocopta cristata]
MMYYCIFPFLLTTILVLLYFFTLWKAASPSSSKESPFECGFDPMSSMRKPFSLRFFLLIILFLIFDVEVVLLFPILTQMKMATSTVVLAAYSTFLLMLLGGLFYEWAMGALDWIK